MPINNCLLINTIYVKHIYPYVGVFDCLDFGFIIGN
jgi:hypothetical protein